MNEIVKISKDDVVARVLSLDPLQLVAVSRFLSDLDNLQNDWVKASEPVLSQVWDNEEDAVYDRY
jgi:hypothetical protein